MTTPRTGLHPGATWKRVDFQIHTPRDPQWTGSPHLPGGPQADEQAREKWAAKLVSETCDRGLDAIAITDHHDFSFIPYVRAALDSIDPSKPRPWLFPGVEVTCRDSVQCIILFDENTDEFMWNRIFGGHLQKVHPADPNAAVADQPRECGQNIEDLIKSVTSDAQISPIAILLPHASDDGAHKSMLRQGFHARFKDSNFDGVYTEKSFASLNPSTIRKIHGEVHEWGNIRRGLIPTGDNRSADFSKLGANECWIRMGEPTAESIRQAVLADEARIAYEAPAVPAHRILDLHVSSSLTGADFCISFNDGFTTLIGGRGSGKSATLEYLRFALGRSSIDIHSSDDEPRPRERRLIQDTLSSGQVSVTLERDGIKEVWSRAGSNPETIQITNHTDSESIDIPIDDAQQRFPARAFYQKQLSSLVTQTETASEQITNIAAAEYIESRRRLDREIDAAKRKVKSAFQQAIEYWVAKSGHEKSKAALADLNRRLQSVRNQLNEAGLSDDHQRILDSAPKYNLARRLFDEARESIASDIEDLRKVRHGLASLRPDHWNTLKDDFQDAHDYSEALDTARASIHQSLDSALQTLESVRHKRDAMSASFDEKHRQFESEHQAAAAERENLQHLLDESERLNERIQEEAANERQKASQLDQLSDAPEALARSRTELEDKIAALRGLLDNAAGQVQEMSAESLRARREMEGAPRQYTDALLKICDGNRIRDVQSRCETRVAEVVAEEDRRSWSALVDSLLEVFQHRIEVDESASHPGEQVRTEVTESLLSPLTEQQLDGIYKNITESTMADALTAIPEDYIAFEYRDGNHYVEFEQASPGQQSAALLQLLLTQEAGTLIIDQPEEDLDNRTIMRIARLLQKHKRKRQLVFATHNPNFVVNGDADKVITLEPNTSHASERIEVEVDGAIETQSVRDAIADTMEGGRAAFELRGKKYRFPRE